METGEQITDFNIVRYNRFRSYYKYINNIWLWALFISFWETFARKQIIFGYITLLGLIPLTAFAIPILRFQKQYAEKYGKKELDTPGNLDLKDP